MNMYIEISLRMHGRPAIVRGQVKQYRCVEEYIPSVEDLEDSMFDPNFIHNGELKSLFFFKIAFANLKPFAKHIQ